LLASGKFKFYQELRLQVMGKLFRKQHTSFKRRWPESSMLRTQRLLLIKPQEHPTDKSKELLSALLTPHVIEFIDFRKLAFSSLILDLATNAALHAIQHGDTGYIDKILEIFKGNQYATQMKNCSVFELV
ncbi:hypothetical protein, partial [Pseudomonas syringae]|uniref:hypothetical protein n=3 Tax=Pseudomonas syringae TaxID=317 RepID=UPI001F2DF6C2